MAVRSLKWVLRAQDATAGAFRSFGRRLKNAASRVSLFKAKIVGLGAAITSALGGKALDTFADIERTATAFADGTDEDIKKVDALRQAMELAGGSADELLGTLAQVQANLGAAITDPRLMETLQMFGVTPNMNAVDATIAMLDRAGQAKRDGTLDLLLGVMGEGGRRGLVAFRGEAGGASTFIAGAETIDPRVARNAEVTQREVAAASANVERNIGTFIDAVSPLIRMVARVLSGRENPAEGVLEQVRNQPGFGSDLTLMERYLREISTNTKEQGVLRD